MPNDNEEFSSAIVPDDSPKVSAVIADTRANQQQWAHIRPVSFSGKPRSEALVKKVKFISWHEWWAPYVVYIAAFFLTFNAGFLNGSAMAGMYHYGSITSVSGCVSHLAVDVERKHWYKARQYFYLLVSFFLGSAICGIYIPSGDVAIGKRRYGLALCTTAIFITLAAMFPSEDFSKCFIALACGLQNGMATQFSGAVMRTTHVTGTITDVGLLIGRMIGVLLRGQDKDLSTENWKLQFLCLELFGFFMGSVVGSEMWEVHGDHVLYIPAVMSAAMGITYRVYRQTVERA